MGSPLSSCLGPSGFGWVMLARQTTEFAGWLSYPAAMGADFTPQQVAELHSKHGIQLIDVRQDYEWAAGRIEGARQIELSELGAEASTLERDRTLVFYCRSGVRSAMATEAFSEAGFDAHNLVGGLIAWEAAGLPIEPDGGYVAD